MASSWHIHGLKLWRTSVCGRCAIRYSVRMDLFALTRKLIDIESITGNEAAVG